MTSAGAGIIDLPSMVDEAIDQIASAGDDFKGDCAALREMHERLESGRFHLAVLGQFKRGKSTLLNALLGQNVLPAAVVPLTAVPTWVRFGPGLRGRVEFSGQAVPEEFTTAHPAELRRFLERYVTESGNPHNRLGVAKVEVFLAADILKDGVVFIDTPGIGSTLRHNTETTMQFLPQCDAALFLVSADPPVTETEVDFLKSVRPNVDRLFFVLNKVDYLQPTEVEDAVAFFRRVISAQVGQDHESPVFAVSAREGLEAKIAGDLQRWRESGMAEVERHLLDFLAREKMDSLRSAVRRKAADIIEDVILRLGVLLRTLELPLEDLRRRMGVFDERIEDMQRERQAAQDLLAGDKRRAHESLQRQYEELCRRGLMRLGEALDGALTRADTSKPDEGVLQAALDAAVPDLFRNEFEETIRRWERQLAEVLGPHRQRTDRLVESVRKTAADLFEVPYRPLESTVAVEATRQPYWVSYRYEQTFGNISPGVIERLLPPGIRRRRIDRRFRDKVEALVLFNAGKLREKFYDQIESTFRRFRTLLDERLSMTIAATHGAARAAVQKRETHAGAVASEVQRLGVTIGALEKIAGRLVSAED